MLSDARLGDGLPQIWFGYNPNHQIFQTPEHVVIFHEMFHQRRIIPLDGRPHANITQWNGEPRGRWEGDTLVVESRDFPDRPHDRWNNTWRTPTSRRDPNPRRLLERPANPVRKHRPWAATQRLGAFPISRSRAHTHRRHGHPLQTVPSAGLIERPQEKNRVDALR